MAKAAAMFGKIPPRARTAISVLCALAAAAETMGPAGPGGDRLFLQVEGETGTPADLLGAVYVYFPPAVPEGADRATAAAAVLARVRDDGHQLATAAALYGWAHALRVLVEERAPPALDVGVLTGEVAQLYALQLARRADGEYLTVVGGAFGG